LVGRYIIIIIYENNNRLPSIIGIFIITTALTGIGIFFLLQFYITTAEGLVNNNDNNDIEHSKKTISIMAVGDSIGYNIDSKRLYNLGQIYLQFRVLNLQKTILMENLEYGYLDYEYDRSFSVHKL
jgi:hypothetical protein